MCVWMHACMYNVCVGFMYLFHACKRAQTSHARVVMQRELAALRWPKIKANNVNIVRSIRYEQWSVGSVEGVILEIGTDHAYLGH